MTTLSSQSVDIFASTCPTRTVLSRISGRWTMLVILVLRADPAHFNALRRTISGISQKMLAQTLRELEEDGLVWRRVLDTKPPKVLYGLTDLGTSLSRVVEPLRDWSYGNFERIQEANARYASASSAAGPDDAPAAVRS